MIVEQQPNPRWGRVDLVQFTQQGNEIGTGVAVGDDLGDAAGMKIETGQQRHRSQPLVFVIPQVAGVLIRRGRQICQTRQSRALPAARLRLPRFFHRRPRWFDTPTPGRARHQPPWRDKSVWISASELILYGPPAGNTNRYFGRLSIGTANDLRIDHTDDAKPPISI